MKIKGRCRVCSREFPADLLINETAGRCPFCGTPADVDYSGNFVLALGALERAGSAVEAALDQLSALGPNFELDENSILDPIRVALAQRTKGTVAQRGA